MIYRNLISRYIENFDISAGDTIRYDTIYRYRIDISIFSIYRYSTITYTIHSKNFIQFCRRLDGFCWQTERQKHNISARYKIHVVHCIISNIQIFSDAISAVAVIVPWVLPVCRRVLLFWSAQPSQTWLPDIKRPDLRLLSYTSPMLFPRTQNYFKNSQSICFNFI